MRIIFNISLRKSYFKSIKLRSALTWTDLARTLKVNIRELYDWRKGKYSIPIDFCKKIEEVFKISIPKNARYKNEYSHTSDAGRKGALNRYVIYGNPGTKEGRKKGGMNSIIVNKAQQTAFDNIKNILEPKYTDKLAEAMGILIGDGGISYYQVKISLDSTVDRHYVPYVKKLFEELFNINVSIHERQKESVIEIVMSSRKLVLLLNTYGLPIGNKIRHNIAIPKRIMNDICLSRACIRGIFDTDGSIYLDTHRTNRKVYKNVNIALTSYAAGLLKNIEEMLVKEGFHPTLTSKRSIRIRRRSEVIRFFDIIGSSNPKNIQKYHKFVYE